MNLAKLARSALFAIPLAVVLPAQAATLSYDLTLNNLTAWTGVTLARVTLMDNTSIGGVDITVDALIEGSRVSSFGFNFTGSTQPAGTFGITGLPANWVYAVNIFTGDNSTGNGGFDGFGKFDVAVYDTGQNNWVDPMNIHVSIGTVADYLDLSSNLSSLFAAHITNLDDRGPGYGSCSAANNNVTCTALTGFAGGGTVVPVPAAVWLFGSGLLGLAGIARRKRSA